MKPETKRKVYLILTSIVTFINVIVLPIFEDNSSTEILTKQAVVYEISE